MQRETVATRRLFVATATNSADLEIKDAQLIFGGAWRELEGQFGRSKMRFPRELILLGGAPGAGKGTNSDFIRNVRSIDAPPVVISQLLDTPEALAIKARGGMVGDREVVGILFRKLLEPEYENGALLDGFPRTKVQVECLKLLFDEMIALRREFSGTAEEIHFKQPLFHIMVLFVEEAESVARQLKRGRRWLPTMRRLLARAWANYGRRARRTLAKCSLGIATAYLRSKLTTRSFR